MTDRNDAKIHPAPWPSDIEEALPGAALPRQWADAETPPATTPSSTDDAAADDDGDDDDRGDDDCDDDDDDDGRGAR